MAAITRRNPRKTLDTQGRGDDSFMASKIIAAVAAAVGASLAAAACLTTPASARATPAGHAWSAVWSARPERPGPPRGTAGGREAIGPPADARRTFGSGCRILHRGGPGSEPPLATAPLATALSRAPGLSQLAHAIRRSGLTQMLDAAKALTVFAPDNAAFAAVGAGNLRALLATRPDLVRVLKFHLVAGRVTPAQLRKRHVFTTVAGTKLYLGPSGHSAGVNNATVTCGNVRTSNATVYVVDRLIVPGT